MYERCVHWMDIKSIRDKYLTIGQVRLRLQSIEWDHMDGQYWQWPVPGSKFEKGVGEFESSSLWDRLCSQR